MAQHDGTLRRMLDAESAIGDYNMASSVKTDSNFHFDNKDHSITDNSITHDYDRRHSETQSVQSYATSVYSEVTVDSDRVGGGGKKVKKFQKIVPTNNNKKFQHMNKARGSFPKQQVTLPTIAHDTPSSPPKPQDYGGGLAKKLKTHHGIRESMEMDLNTSLRSQSGGSAGIPSARESVIAKKSVITLRMISNNPKKQIRVKLFLPLSEENNIKPQIIVLFVNKGSTMGICKSFVEDSYPNGILQGCINQLCIADDDGDIDEDFPPINENQDMTTLGIQNFWIDRIFDAKDRKPSIIYSEQEMSIKKSNVNNKNNVHDKHRDTVKESLLKKNVKHSDYGSSDDSHDDGEDYTSNRCCWCCFKNNGYIDDADDDEADIEHSLEMHTNNNNQPNVIKPPYSPPSNGNNKYDAGNRTSAVQYASL